MKLRSSFWFTLRGSLTRFPYIMALPHWMNITLRLVSNVTAFLLNDPPTECPLASLSYEERYRNSDSSASILDTALSFVAISIGLDLPRTLTVVDGLSVATAFLLRLTENVPAEVLLFLMVSGATFWLFIVLLLGCGTVGIFGFLLLYFTQGTQYPSDQRGVSNTPENEPTVSLSSPELPELSNAAQTLIPTATTYRCTTRSRRNRQT